MWGKNVCVCRSSERPDGKHGEWEGGGIHEPGWEGPKNRWGGARKQRGRRETSRKKDMFKGSRGRTSEMERWNDWLEIRGQAEREAKRWSKDFPLCNHTHSYTHTNDHRQRRRERLLLLALFCLREMPNQARRVSQASMAGLPRRRAGVWVRSLLEDGLGWLCIRSERTKPWMGSANLDASASSSACLGSGLWHLEMGEATQTNRKKGAQRKRWWVKRNRPCLQMSQLVCILWCVWISSTSSPRLRRERGRWPLRAAKSLRGLGEDLERW